MVIAVWVQVLGGSGGGWSTLARPSHGVSEAWRSGHISPGREPVAGQDSRWYPSASGPSLRFELVGAAGGDLLVVQLAGDGVVAQAGGGADQRPGQGGAVPGSLHQDGSAGVCLDAELVDPVIHDRPVAEGACGQLESRGDRSGAGTIVAGPAGLVPAGGDRGQDPGAGAAGVFAGPGQGERGREVRATGDRAGQAGHGDDAGFQCPVDLAQRLAFVVLTFAVVALAHVPAADVARAPHTTRITGVGGTGVVTLSQVLSAAGRIAGRQVRSLDQTGLAQKGGAVISDVKISAGEIEQSNKAAAGECDLYLGCDLLVAADAKNLAVADPETTIAVVSTTKVPTGKMVVDKTGPFPDVDATTDRIRSATRGAESVFVDARGLSVTLFGTDQFANVLLALPGPGEGTAERTGHGQLPALTKSVTIGYRGSRAPVAHLRQAPQFVRERRPCSGERPGITRT